MSTFNGHFLGFSTATLELLSQGFEQIWLEKRLEAEVERKRIQQRSVERPTGADAGVTSASRDPQPSATVLDSQTKLF